MASTRGGRVLVVTDQPDQPERAPQEPLPGMMHEEHLSGLPDVSTHGYTETQLPHREHTRRGILIFLGTVLGAVVVAWLAGAAFLPPDRAEQLSDVADKIFAGVIGAFGVAVGFYFQSVSKE